MNKLLMSLLALGLVAGLAGCTDNNGDESSDNVGADGDCENRNMVDDDVIGDDDGVTLGECEENAADR